MIRTSKKSIPLYKLIIAFASLVVPKRAVFVQINQFNVAFLKLLNITHLRRESPFHHKVVYGVVDGH